MAVVLEDGTGRATANTLALKATVTSFWADRGGHPTWDALASNLQDARVVIATDYLHTNPRYARIRGQKLLATQRLMWPRKNATMRDGTPLASNIVPQAWIDAVCLLAPIADSLPSLLPTLDRGGKIVSESLTGVGSTTYAEDAPAGKVIQYVDGILGPYLLAESGFDPSDFDTSLSMGASIGVPKVFDSEYFASGAADDASATE